MSILGISAFSKGTDGKLSLTDEQKKTLQDNKFSLETIEGFDAALANDFSSEVGDETPPSSSLNDLAAALAHVSAQLEATNKTNSATAQQLVDLQAEKQNLENNMSSLQTQIEQLKKAPEEDTGAGTQIPNAMNAQFNLEDTKQLGGMEGLRFSLDRPYNQRARAMLMQLAGYDTSHMTISAGPIDVDFLKAD
ncbi:MAG: hypothetical protein LBB41_02720, partial [Prevotellaceae bacterium]|nr:hypothetical protein [Prevotellaceae bacterium]